VHLLIAGGVLWVCAGTPLACGLGLALRSAAGRDEARWRVLGIAEAFLTATERAAEAVSAGEAAIDAFVAHRHRAWMARVELAAVLGERCDAIERATDVLAALADQAGRQQATFQDSRAAFARAVWDAVDVAGASARQSPRPPTGSTALV
jgi:hypothetical protein